MEHCPAHRPENPTSSQSLRDRWHSDPPQSRRQQRAEGLLPERAPSLPAHDTWLLLPWEPVPASCAARPGSPAPLPPRGAGELGSCAPSGGRGVF